MLLQRLREYQSRTPVVVDEQVDLSAEYTVRRVPWIVYLDHEGKLRQIVRTSGGIGARDAGKPLKVPLLRRSGTRIKPQLLADTAEFVFGVSAENSTAKRAVGRHREFVALAEACAIQTNNLFVQAVVSFLHLLDGCPGDLPEDMSASDWVTFQVDDTRPIDVETVQSFWAAVAPRLGEKGLPDLTSDLVLSWMDVEVKQQSGTCLVCGEMKPIARVHPVAIRVPRAVADQQLSIVSANKEAFWSYGLEQSFLAPTCRPCAEAYARALNRLIQDEASHLVIGNAVFVFWTREDVGFNLWSYLTDPQPEQVRGLIDSARSGKAMPEVDETAFYATALSSSGGRAVVRDWIDTTIGEVQSRLRDWFKWQTIVGGYGEETHALALHALAVATVREPRDLAPPVPRALFRTALTGTPLPVDLLHQAVRRIRAEQGGGRNRRRDAVSRSRVALIKLVLLSRFRDNREDYMVQLDVDNPNQAYRCGRLLAVLERAQKLAVPNITNTVASRFYGAASSAPAYVFARLLQGAKAHLTKMERDRPAVAHVLQVQIEDIAAGIGNFPRVLTLEDQGFFALGYYHQRAWHRKQATERRRGGQVPPAEPGIIANDEDFSAELPDDGQEEN